jgi:DMSO/TMAO reductase YedYZ heme-binding membrane subunit
MSIDQQAILKNKAINEWRLFWLIAIPMSLIMVIKMMSVDLSTGDGVSTMIQFSVRWAVPFIFLVVAASSVQILFPGPFPMWWLRNRKYIGLCFAVAMAWQGTFIFMMSNFFRDYYYEDVYLLRDELEGSIGYIFLSAMVLTSFRFGRKFLTQKQWKLLHKCGIYFLFAYPFSVYWWNLSYYENPLPIDYVFYWGGFLAFVLRIAAWGKKRFKAAKRIAPESYTPMALKALGGVVIAFGLLVASTGLHWQEPVTAFITAPKWSADLVLWLPYWPLEPYLSIFIIGLGAALATKTKAKTDLRGIEKTASIMGWIKKKSTPAPSRS